MNRAARTPAADQQFTLHAICPRCEILHLGSANPPGWERVKVGHSEHLLCADCVPEVKAAAKRARTRKGGAA